MTDSFDLPVMYKGKELLFPSQLLQYGYAHRFIVAVNDMEVLFEPDEEGRYRAVIQPEQLDNLKIDIALLQAIAESINAIVN